MTFCTWNFRDSSCLHFQKEQCHPSVGDAPCSKLRYNYIGVLTPLIFKTSLWFSIPRMMNYQSYKQYNYIHFSQFKGHTEPLETWELHWPPGFRIIVHMGRHKSQFLIWHVPDTPHALCLRWILTEFHEWHTSVEYLRTRSEAWLDLDTSQLWCFSWAFASFSAAAIGHPERLQW